MGTSGSTHHSLEQLKTCSMVLCQETRRDEGRERKESHSFEDAYLPHQTPAMLSNDSLVLVHNSMIISVPEVLRCLRANKDAPNQFN